jgi:hypothetical protein
MNPFGGIRVEIVPDDNAAADPRVPKDVLEALGPHKVLMNFAMMYVRQSCWDGMKHHFPLSSPPSKKEDESEH